ncbi:MAG TPA: hypothetical protein VGU21_08890 [Streptosporangiaceae bacterium]|nr:hypothetical protein [Streptosporangiaceae bacterium]
MSTIGPLAIGVLLAFGWNMLSLPHGAAGAESGITRQVGRTVDEAAAQAWASASPHAVPGGGGTPGGGAKPGGGGIPGGGGRLGPGGSAPAAFGR